MVTLPKSLRWSIAAWMSFGLLAAPLAAKDPKDPGDSKSMKLKDLKDFAREDEDDDDPKKKYSTRIETPLIGEYTTFAGLTPIRVEGVGLVVGLHGTGGNPAPSPYRTALLEDLKRRNVRHPNEILRSPDTALVYLKAMLPPLLEKGETVDVQVWIPDSAEATSLEGGWLMEAYLSEQAFVAGKGQLAGHQFVKVKGPVLLAAAGAKKDKAPALLARGSIIGGGTVLRERELSIYLRNDFRSIRNAIRVAEAISRRFHDFDKHGIQQPMATAKNDQKITLMVHPKYKDNFPRYLQVIRHLAFREQPTAKRLRIQQLKAELFDPDKSEKAALQLEGIGKDGIAALKAALAAPMLECRFHAACALAYLDEPDGVAILAEAAKTEPAFRVYALAAMSVVEDAEAHLALRELMSESSMETRYGAFRSLWVLDRNDPFIRGEKITALEGKTSYMLHEIDTRGEPLVHLATRTRPEIVLFGVDQKLSAPLYLTAGKQIMVTAQAGAEKASIRRFSIDKQDERREVPLNVADVIRAVSELDGTYPDVVQMLMEAAEQNNLQGRFTHDSLPEGGRMYERPAPQGGVAPKSKRKTRIGRDNLTPNLFPLDPAKESDDKDRDESPDAETSAMANVTEDKQQDENSESEDKKPARRKRESEKSSSKVASEKPSVAPPPKKPAKPPEPPKWYTPRVRKFTDEEKPVEKSASKTESKSASQSEPKSKPSRPEPDISEAQTEPK